VVLIGLPLIRDAIDTSILSRISFWDALVVVAAQGANCASLSTEGLHAGQIIRGVKIENPSLAH
jgi:predicted nucleic acid-binding protein